MDIIGSRSIDHVRPGILRPPVTAFIFWLAISCVLLNASLTAAAIKSCNMSSSSAASGSIAVSYTHLTLPTKA